MKAKNNLDFVKMKLTNLDTVFHSTMFDFNVNCLVLKTQMIRKAIRPGSNTGLMVGNMWDFFMTGIVSKSLMSHLLKFVFVEEFDDSSKVKNYLHYPISYLRLPLHGIKIL